MIATTLRQDFVENLYGNACWGALLGSCACGSLRWRAHCFPGIALRTQAEYAEVDCETNIVSVDLLQGEIRALSQNMRGLGELADGVGEIMREMREIREIMVSMVSRSAYVVLLRRLQKLEGEAVQKIS